LEQKAAPYGRLFHRSTLCRFLTDTREVPTGETKKGFLSFEKDVTKKVTKWEQTGYSNREIDGLRLSADIERAVQQLNREGYEVVSVTPVISGAYDFKYEVKFGGVNHGGGVTDMVTDTATRKA